MYRIAFEKGNKAAYEKIGKIILEVSGASSKINGKVTDVHKVLAKAGEYVNLKEITGIASEIESVTKKVSGAFGKVKDIYEDIHKLINVVNVLSGDHKTYENAVGGIELMGEAAGEFYGKVPGMGWYGEYISMSVSRATKTMNKLHESVTKQERDLRNEGDMQNRDYLYYNSPGGIPTFRFMKKVMQAGHPGQIKMEDVTSDIEDFFEEHNESKINNALGGNKDNKMPVKHKTWGDDKIKKREFKSWVFKNRKQIWYMLYGKTNINKAIREESGASKPFQLKD